MNIKSVNCFAFLLFFFLTLNAGHVVAANDVLFIGHAYGTQGGKIIPYPPLEKLLSKNKLPMIRVWGGDLTENYRRFGEFKDFIDFLGGVNLLVRGNHDGPDMWSKTPYWTDYVTPNNIWIHNLDMNEDMKFERLPLRPSIIASHYAYFNELFEPLNIPNSMYGSSGRDLSRDQMHVQKSRVMIAGDCGAFSTLTAGYAEVEIGLNKFICTGMGGGKGFDNVVTIDPSGNVTPFFFDSSGEILQKSCKSTPSNSRFKNSIKTCSAI